MIGGLQGEFGDLDIKYLKQNISKYPKISQNVGRTHLEALGEHSGTMQNGCETLRVSAIRGSGYGWPRKLKRPPLPSGVRRRMRISGWNGGGEDSGCETSGWNAHAPLSGLPQGEAHGTRAYHTPDDSISYPDMLSGWKRPTFRRTPMVCPDALSRHLL